MARDMSVYQRELSRQQERSTRRSGGGGDYQWFSPAKPARKGERTRTQIRILPRPAPEGSGEDYADEWWVTADQHVLTVDGRTRVFNCPDDHDRADGTQVCPLCALRRDLYREKSPASQELAKDLKVRSRAFAVVACPDADSERGPYVWGFSTSLLNQIMEIAVAKRCMVDDPDTGRDMLLTVNRIGPKRYDIRYSITDMDPSEIDAELRAMAGNVPDLSGLTKDASMDDLREIAALLDPRPGGKRASVSAPAPSQTYTAPDPAPAPPRNDPPVVRDVDTSFHYSGAGGDQQGLTVDAVARLVADNEGDDHYVWRDGFDNWKPATDVSEIAEAVKALKPPPAMTPPAPPAGPPKPPGPPRPPKPPGGKAF